MKDFLLINWDHLLVFFATIILTFIAGYVVRKVLNRFIKNLSTDDNKELTNYKFMRYFLIGLTYSVGFFLAVYSVPVFRSIGTTLLAGAGVIALAVSFASQHALSNIISGVFIVIFKPFRINDRLLIKNGQLAGVVEDITLRHVVIRDFENKRIIIPNTIISDEIIINSDYENDAIIRWLDISIGFDTDIDKAKDIIFQEAHKHPLRLDKRSEEDIANGKPEITIRVIGLGDYAVNLRAWLWAKDQSDAFVMSCDLLESIKKRFDLEGINLPYPHQVQIQREDTKNLMG